MTEWEPATETEAAMRDALRAGDQELYFRILARTDLLLPVSAEALAGRAPMGWGTWTTGGRTHVLAFTSTAALHACLAENAGSTRRAPYSELATGWPNPEWWLAVNPGLPIEGYLPAWFVSQLSRGDVRLPGRSMGARARLEQVERAARARATASVPRRPAPEVPSRPEPEGPLRPQPEPPRTPAAPFPRAEPSRTPGVPYRPAEPSREPVASYSSPPEPATFAPADEPTSFSPAAGSTQFSPGAESAPFPSRAESAPFPSRADPTPFPSRAESASFPSVVEPDSFSSGVEPRRFSPHAEPTGFSSPAEPTRFSSLAEPARLAPAVEPEPTPSSGPPATVPVIAPTPDRGDRRNDFGSQISEDTSAGWMTPAGPGRFGGSKAANGTPTAPVEASARSGESTVLSGTVSAGPPPAWYGPGGQATDQQVTAPITGSAAPRTVDEPAPVARPPEAPPAEVRAPEPWTPTAQRAEASLFTPVSRQPVAESWSGGSSESTTTAFDAAPAEGTTTAFDAAPAEGTTTAFDAAPAERMSSAFEAAPAERMSSGPTYAEAAQTEPIVAGPVASQPSRAESIFGGSGGTEQISTSAGVGEPVATGTDATEPIFTSSGPTEPAIFDPPVVFDPPAVFDPPVAIAPEPEPVTEPVPAEPAPAPPASTADSVPPPRLPPDFVPANDVERSLLDAAGDGSTDTFLSTLLLARVLLPVDVRSASGSRPGDDGFRWRTEALDGETYVVVFTSPERLGDHLAAPIETVAVKFAQLIRRWPDDTWSFAVNPGTPVGAKLPGGQIVALANWAAEVGLGDDTDTGEQAAPATEEEAPRSTYAPAREDPGRPTMMQKTIAPSQLSYYLDRGYDRVSGFVHRASEVAHLRTPAKFYGALGLGYPGSPFVRDADEIYVLRWPAYRPSLYRIPYGGQNEAAMRAMEGWVIERPPFRGNGFAPGESSDVVAEFKVDSVRLPHDTQLWRIGVDGTERLMATLDCDVPVWRRAEED
ncbi:SseB family protein [Plantactinospora soyae]|uniref:SseB protein N-terminal domain-containing protein n=1 Tax=Plantactinospora soyae TaxID=1544732 RepID=A0A927QWJ4_9ACTN|nr:SseB family protein [Plantactinospora soyae]MBE1485627.1 hypothetical protein [Plantactinospora soyae]